MNKEPKSQNAEEILFNGRAYLALKSASFLTGYHSDSLGRLARGGQISSTRIGKQWFIEKDALLGLMRVATARKEISLSNYLAQPTEIKVAESYPTFRIPQELARPAEYPKGEVENSPKKKIFPLLIPFLSTRWLVPLAMFAIIFWFGQRYSDGVLQFAMNFRNNGTSVRNEPSRSPDISELPSPPLISTPITQQPDLPANQPAFGFLNGKIERLKQQIEQIIASKEIVRIEGTHTIEKTIREILAGISEAQVDEKLSNLDNSIQQQINELQRFLSITQRIDNLGTVTVQQITSVQSINTDNLTVGNLTITGTCTGCPSGGSGNVSGWTDDGSFVRLTDSGNLVGIGTSTPSMLLSVHGNILASGDIYLANLIATGTTRFNGITYTWPGTITAGNFLQVDGSGNLTWSAVSGGSGSDANLTFVSGDGGYLRLATTTNRFGIGTTTPYAKLSVSSGGVATTTLALVPVSGQTANILDIYNTSGTLTSVITAQNFFGIGTTSPAYSLSVAGHTLFGGNATTTGLFYSLGSGTSTFAGGIQTGGLSVTGSATSTFANGLRLSAGCFQTSSGTCLSNSGGDATTLDTIDSTQFLRSDTSDQFTSGTLTFNAGTNLQLSNIGPNIILSTDSSGNVVGTTTPSFASIIATSTTATSTFAGGLTLNGTGFVVNQGVPANSFNLSSSGNLGLGTTSPLSKLSVSGSAHFDATTTIGLLSTDANSIGLLDIRSSTTTLPALIYGRGSTDYLNNSEIASNNATSTFFLRFDDSQGLGVGNGYSAGYGTSSLLFGVDMRGALTQSLGTSSMVKVGSVSFNPGESSGNSVVVLDRYAFVLTANDPAQIIAVDISNPSAPQRVSSITLDSGEGQGYTIAVAGRYAYVTTRSTPTKLVVVDISNPSVMQRVGAVSFNSGENNGSYIVVSGRYAYVTAYDSPTNLVVVDIANPSSPQRVGAISLSGEGHSVALAVAGKYAYITTCCTTPARVIVVDISNPSAPQKVGAIDLASGEDNGNSIAISGRYAYVATLTIPAKVSIIDISNPISPQRVGGITLPSDEGQGLHISAQGRYVYVSTNSSRKLVVIDASNPTSPKRVGAVSLLNSFGSFAISGRYAYGTTNTSPATLVAIDLGGSDFASLFAHSLGAGSLQVQGSTNIGRGLNIGAGLSVADGILSQGPVSISLVGTSSNSYSNTSLLSLTHSTSTFAGTGILLDFAKSTNNPLNGGIFTGNFVQFNNASSTKFIVNSEGWTGIATSSPGSNLSIQSVANFQAGTSTIYSGLTAPGFRATSSGVTISGGALQITSSATSTSNNGFAISAGCYQTPSGTCLTSSGGDATTLDGIDSLSFLRSDTSDNYTSGTLTFDAGTNLQLSNLGANMLLSTDGTGVVRSTSTPSVAAIFATSTATSTFAGGVSLNVLNISTTTATSTVANGFRITGGGLTFSQLNCSILTNGGVLTTNSSGGVICQDDDVGTFGSVPVFDFAVSPYAATSTTLLLKAGLISYGSTTAAGNLTTGALTATSSIFTINASTTNLSALSRITVGGTATTTIFGDNSTSTFAGGLSVSALNVGTTTATSTFANGIRLVGGGLTIATANCSGLSNGGSLTTDGSGNVICSADDSGSSASYPFTPTTIGGTEHSASTTRPFYFSQGLLTASTTAGIGIFGTVHATNTGSTFNGITITCTDCITDTNVADLAVGGDVTGTLSATIVGDNSHAHDSTTISGLDVSADINLTAGDGLTLTDDDIDCDTASASALGCLAAVDFIAFGKKTAFSFATTFATSSMATSSSIWLQGGAIYSSSTNATSTFDGGLRAGLLHVSSTTATSTFASGIKLNGLTFTNLASSNCSGLANGGKLTTDANGGVICSAENGSSASYPFTSQTIGGTAHQATSSPMYFSSGLLAASSTLGYLNVGTLDATSTTATSTFAGGLTVDGNTFVVDWFNNRVGIGTTTPGATFSVNGGSLLGGSATTTGFFYSQGLIGTSTFTGGLSVSALNVGTTTATSTFASGIKLNGLTFTNLGGSNCSSLANGGKLTTDANGGVICTAENGSSFGYPFTPLTIGAINYSATSTTLQLTGGLISYGSSTMNHLALGTLTSTSTVGVGTTTPWGLLSVESVQGIVGANTPIFVVADQGTSTPLLLIDGNRGFVGLGTTSPFARLSIHPESGQQGFVVGSSTTQFIVDRFGNVGVGTSTPSPISTANTGGLIAVGGAGTSTFIGGVQAGGINSSNGVTLTGGALLATNIASFMGTSTISNLSVLNTSTSTLLGGLSAQVGGLSSTAGVTVTGGNILLTSGATSTFNNGIALSAGCYQTPSGTCLTSSGGDATTLDAIDSTQFLRSDTNDSFTSGTLTFNAGTTLQLSNVGPNIILSTDSSGNVVGTTTPSFASIIATSTTATSTFAGGLSVGGSFGFNILQNGNVGVGTATPSQKLDVVGNIRLGTPSSNSSITFPFSSAGLAPNITSNYNGGSLTITAGDTGVSQVLLGATGVLIGVGTDTYVQAETDSDYVRIGIANSEALRVINGGNVGIGETVPGSRLSVSGGATIGISYDTLVAPSNGLLVEGNLGIGTTSPYAKLSVGGRGVFDGDVRADYFTATSSTATSTFAGGISVNVLNISTTTATSTVANGFRITGGGLTFSQLDCSGLGNGGALTTNSSGGVICSADDSGSSASYPFTATTIGGTVHQATSTDPFYFGKGLLAASSTLGYLNVGTLDATSTSATSTFAGGLTVDGNTFVVDWFNNRVGIGTTTPGATFSVNGGSLLGGSATTTGFFYSQGVVGTSTFAGGLSVSALNVGTTTATSTFANGIRLVGGGLTIATANCSGLSNGGSLTTDGSGNVICSADDSGSSASYPFTPTTIGGTEHSASTTRPFYFSQGLLTASTTAGIGIFGTVHATNTGSTFNGITITCTDCITDTNVADLALGGDVTGTLSAITVTDNSHAHDTTTISGIDISADTNLTAGDGITLNDDDLDCDTASGSVFGCLSTATFEVFNNKFGGIYATTFASSTFATSTSFWTGGAFYASSSRATSTFDGGLFVNVLNISTTTATSTVANGFRITGGGLTFSQLDCSGLGNGGALTTNSSGGVICSADDSGSSASYPFTATTIGGTVHQATSTDPFYFGKGLLAASSTLGYLNVGTLDATSTSATSTFAGGLTVDGSTFVVDWFNNRVGIGTSTPGATFSVNGGSLLGGSATTTGFFYSQGVVGTSTFAGGLSVGALNVGTTTATSTFASGIKLNGLTFTNLAGSNCSGLANGGKLTTDANGGVTCQADVSGAGSSLKNPFDVTTIGGTAHQASSTDPFYFGKGLLAASSTLGYLNVGYIDATSTATSTFAGGVSTAGLSSSNSLTVSGGDVVFDGGGLIYDASTNRLGLGLRSTVAQLHLSSGPFVIGSSPSEGFQLGITGADANIMGHTGSSATKLTMIAHSAGPYVVLCGAGGSACTQDTLALSGSGDADALIIANTNFVGIGTSSPGSLLSIQSVANFQAGTSTIYTGLVVPGLFASSSGITLGGGSFVQTNNATNTFGGGLSITTGGLTLSTLGSSGCSGLGNGGKLTTDANGGVICSADVSGAGSSLKNPFDVTTIGGTPHQASSTDPFYFGKGLLAASSTLGYLNVGTLDATSTSATSTFAGGLTVDGSTFVVDWFNNRVGIGTTTPGATFSVNGGSLFGGSATTTGFFYSQGLVGTSTFLGGLSVSSLNVGTTTATSTFANGIRLVGGGLTIATANCSALANGGKLTTDGSGNVSCSSDIGSTASYPFTPLTIGAINYSATSTTLQLTGGLISYGSSTMNHLALGSLTSTSTVGVGTTTPWGFLSVEILKGKTNNDTPAFVVSGIGTTSPSLLVHANGLVGIGSTTPWGQFSIGADNQKVNANVPIFVVSDKGTSTPFLLVHGNRGYTGIGTTSPWGEFSIELENRTRNLDNGTPVPGFVVSSRGTSTPFLLVSGNNGNVGIGTTTPWSRFSVSGNTVLNSNLITLASTTASSLTVNYSSAATSTILSNSFYSWSIATSTTARPIFSIDTRSVSGSSAIATTSIWGSFVLDGGAFTYDSATGTVSIDSLSAGPMSFDTDAGVVSWIDMGSATTSAGRYNSYSAMMDASPVLTVFGTTTTSGAITRGTVGIGTTTPQWALTVVGGICISIGVTCPATEVNGGLRVDTAGVAAGDDPGDVFDIAERYPSSEPMAPGEIAGLDSATTSRAMVKKARAGDTAIGIVSTRPALAINGSDIILGATSEGTSTHPLIALTGRVPVKVNLDGGPIKKGDKITLSSIPGVGMRATTSGVTLGIALEDFAEDKLEKTSQGEIYTKQTTGTVLVFVNLGWMNIQPEMFTFASSTIKASYVLDMDGKDIVNVNSMISESGNWSLDENGKLTVEEVHTKKLCLEDICITKDELKSLLDSVGQRALLPPPPPSPEASEGTAPPEEETVDEVIPDTPAATPEPEPVPVTIPEPELSLPPVEIEPEILPSSDSS